MNIVEFAQKVQGIAKQPIRFTNCRADGISHTPIVSIILVLPNGKEYVGNGSNKFSAKEHAIDQALKDCCFENGFLTTKQK